MQHHPVDNRRRLTRILVPCLVAALASCATAPQTERPSWHPQMNFLPPERMWGDIIASPERYEFQGCSFVGTPEVGRTLAPWMSDRSLVQLLRVVLIGQRTPPLAQGESGFGDLSRYPCEIRALRIVSVYDPAESRSGRAPTN